MAAGDSSGSRQGNGSGWRAPRDGRDGQGDRRQRDRWQGGKGAAGDRRDRGGQPRGTAGAGRSSDRAGRDPRRSADGPHRPRQPKPAPQTGPELPEDADPGLLAREIRDELRSLSKVNAERVAGHLVAAGMLVDEDPTLALEHAREARRTAGRIGVVREAAGITAYHAGEWAEALSELRAARRMTGDVTHLPVIADCERALGRPERALEIAHQPEAAKLPEEQRVELRMVEAGARRDLGEYGAAVVTLQAEQLDRSKRAPWSARLWYAYADALLAAGRPVEARDWFAAAAVADEDDLTDAYDRIEELDALDAAAAAETGPHPAGTDGEDADAEAGPSAAAEPRGDAGMGGRGEARGGDSVDL